MALSLVEVVLEKTDALRLLEEAYDAESGTSKGQAAAVNSVVEIAREKGFYGSLELALGLLQRSRRFLVEKEPAGRWVAVRRAVRQSTTLVPVGTERRSTALVPIAAGHPSAVQEFRPFLYLLERVRRPRRRTMMPTAAKAQRPGQKGRAVAFPEYAAKRKPPPTDGFCETISKPPPVGMDWLRRESSFRRKQALRIAVVFGWSGAVNGS